MNTLSQRLLGIAASCLMAGSLLAACAGPVQGPMPANLRAQTARVAPVRQDALFPVQKGYRWDYGVTIAPVMDPYAEEKGTYSLTIDEAKPSPEGTVLELRGLSGFTENYSFPTLVQGPKGVTLKDMTFLGIGSDEVKGLSIDFVRQPLQPGMRWEEENWLAKVVGMETVTVAAGTYQAWHIDVIGTFDHAYTYVGDYWIAPGAGVVKAVYTVPDFHVSMELTAAGLRRPATMPRPVNRVVRPGSGRLDLPRIKR